jgi:hypothetical protein
VSHFVVFITYTIITTYKTKKEKYKPIKEIEKKINLILSSMHIEISIVILTIKF